MTVARPEAAENLDVEEATDGLVLVQTTTRVHRLNPTASFVFALCDGTHTTDEIADAVQAAWDLDERPLELVIECLAQLRAEGVIA